jgi:uncharacterized membrane protein YjjP (DUF1212 family)
MTGGGAKSHKRGGRSNWQIFRWPLAMALANIAGLVTTLFGGGWFNFISWAALGLTLVVIVAAWRGNLS